MFDHRIWMGEYSAEYFNRARTILYKEGIDTPVLMQLFQKQDAVVCGLQEAAQIIKSNGEPVEIHSLQDGDHAAPWETIMTIRGPLRNFVHLESVYLGVIRDATTVATNMRELVTAANGKKVLYLADRFNGYENQARQGYAATIGGATGVCTPSMVTRLGGQPIGTMAHALIAAFDGDLVAACDAFIRSFPDVDLVALVDFHNDCVTEACRVAKAFPARLMGVRLDTSEKMQDKCFWRDGQPLDRSDLYGVNPQLVRNVRTALNAQGNHSVKIIVSGGFNADKIRCFEAMGVPVDTYGVGSSVLRGGSDITADVVWPVGKEGRIERPNPRLQLVH